LSFLSLQKRSSRRRNLTGGKKVELNSTERQKKQTVFSAWGAGTRGSAGRRREKGEPTELLRLSDIPSAWNGELAGVGEVESNSEVPQGKVRPSDPGKWSYGKGGSSCWDKTNGLNRRAIQKKHSPESMENKRVSVTCREKGVEDYGSPSMTAKKDRPFILTEARQRGEEITL